MDVHRGNSLPHMSAILRSKEAHFTLATLWEFRMNRKALLMDEIGHLAECDECLLLLGLCQTSESLSEAERTLRELGKDTLRTRMDH
jgi:hypothetical protein